MGYYTYHKLEVVKGATEQEVEDLMEFFESDEDWSWNLAEFEGVILRGEESKWYKCEEDMVALSNKYPHIVFRLDGNGEENGDMWRMYCYNGKKSTYYPEITFHDSDYMNDLTL